MKLMRQQASPEFVANFWNAFFPRQIPDRRVIAEELKGSVIDLEGHDLGRASRVSRRQKLIVYGARIAFSGYISPT